MPSFIAEFWNKNKAGLLDQNWSRGFLGFCILSLDISSSEPFHGHVLSQKKRGL